MSGPHFWSQKCLGAPFVYLVPNIVVVRESVRRFRQLVFFLSAFDYCITRTYSSDHKLMVAFDMAIDVDDYLEGLLRRKANLETRIAGLRRQASERARKLDARRKILAGAVLMAAAKDDERVRTLLVRLLDKHLSSERDRSAFEGTDFDPASVAGSQREEAENGDA